MGGGGHDASGLGGWLGAVGGGAAGSRSVLPVHVLQRLQPGPSVQDQQEGAMPANPVRRRRLVRAQR